MIANRTRVMLAALGLICIAGEATATDISIVGSSTVYPFMRTITKEFATQSQMKVTVEATGTGTGFDYFCAGMGEFLPDINNASTPMTRDDYRTCRRNGVREIVAFTIGFDGVVAFRATSKSLPSLSREELYRALANEVFVDGKFTPNPYTKWSDINPALSDKPIKVFGPPATSGTRLYIENFVLGELCLLAQNPGSDLQQEITRRRCEKIRTDGAYVEVGEDDAFLIQSVLASDTAIGLVGYGQYLAHQAKLSAIEIEGIAPTSENISSGRYGLSRPLFVYVKRRNMERKPEVTKLLKLFFQPDIVQRLSRAGLIPLPEDRRLESLARLENHTNIECPSRYCSENERR